MRTARRLFNNTEKTGRLAAWGLIFTGIGAISTALSFMFKFYFDFFPSDHPLRNEYTKLQAEHSRLKEINAVLSNSESNLNARYENVKQDQERLSTENARLADEIRRMKANPIAYSEADLAKFYRDYSPEKIYQELRENASIISIGESKSLFRGKNTFTAENAPDVDFPERTIGFGNNRCKLSITTQLGPPYGPVLAVDETKRVIIANRAYNVTLKDKISGRCIFAYSQARS